ncbi:MAG TPA: shikimate kinase [Bacillota bacterium]|nr:shikimate kinase [Bacillota bacterium]
MIKSNIVLIGMPGAGKSTIGVLLAKALGMSFIDTDLLIQEHEGRLLQEIINRDGIAAFLEIEESILLQVKAEHSLIATGGSAVYSEQAMKYLGLSSYLFYLRLSYQAMTERLQNISTRGIVLAKGQSLADLYQERALLYERYADTVIDCSERSIEETVQLAMNAYRNNLF